jgi:hypothetical protein
MTLPVADTSLAALESVQPAVPSIRQRIYDYIASRGAEGATTDEVEAALNIPGNTVRPRMRELEFGNLKTQIMFSWTTRATRRGRQAHVYVQYPLEATE